MLQALLGPIGNIATTFLKNRAEKAKAKQKLAVAKIEAATKKVQSDANWEEKAMDASANSWKDEWFTILLSIPLLAVGAGVVMDDPLIIDRVKSGFQALEELPDWYSYLLFLAVSASFGVKGVDKLMNLRKK